MTFKLLIKDGLGGTIYGALDAVKPGGHVYGMFAAALTLLEPAVILWHIQPMGNPTNSMLLSHHDLTFFNMFNRIFLRTEHMLRNFPDVSFWCEVNSFVVDCWLCDVEKPENFQRAPAWTGTEKVCGSCSKGDGEASAHSGADVRVEVIIVFPLI